MSLKVGFTTVVNDGRGNYENGLMQLRGNDASRLPGITVGSQDFILIGKKPQVINWLITTNKPIRCFQGYGTHVRMTLHNVAKTWQEEYVQQFAIALGGGGSLTGVSASFVAGQLGGEALAVFNAMNLPVPISIDGAQDTVFSKLFGGSKMICVFEPAMVPQHARASLRPPSIEMANNISSTVYGNGLKFLANPD